MKESSRSPSGNVNLDHIPNTTNNLQTGKIIGSTTLSGTLSTAQSESFDFKKVKSRRAFFDEVLEHIRTHPKIERSKLLAYFQYTTGASETMIYNALKVLEELDLIVTFEKSRLGLYFQYFSVKEVKEE